MYSILIDGQWQNADSADSFSAIDPQTGQPLEGEYPVSQWADCEKALAAAATAARQLDAVEGSQVAAFLRAYADNIEENSGAICRLASAETALPVSPRLADVELFRTTNQLRQAADAAESEVWRKPVLDAGNKLATCQGPIGPVLVIGPNNFPLAFNAISGGDFAAAIAAGNPVIAKAHPSHPGTTRLLAEQALKALESAGLPLQTVQMIYHMSPEDGLKMVADERLAAVGFTGSRPAGLAIKAAADAAGKPAYLEMSSVNPVFILPGALQEMSELHNDLANSCLLGTGQFCTCPNLFVLIDSEEARGFVDRLQAALGDRAPGTLLSGAVLNGLSTSMATLQQAGAEVLTGGNPVAEDGFRFENTLLKVSGDQFLSNAINLQTEGFGPMTLGVLVKDSEQMLQVADQIEGSLTGVVYGVSGDELIQPLTRSLRWRVGRIIHNKMPTGVAVSPAMNHGGPFPATGHPGFTAVGLPASIQRFTKLDCYDNVDAEFLPSCLQS